MPFLIVLLVTIIWYFVHRIIQKKYVDFVSENSIYLKKLKEINCNYKFFDHVDFNQFHTYDNEHFYSDIRCVDYLIYQLQFISGKVINQINREK